jgi:hypothetical protein
MAVPLLELYRSAPLYLSQVFRSFVLTGRFGMEQATQMLLKKPLCFSALYAQPSFTVAYLYFFHFLCILWSCLHLLDISSNA